jgi:hypothetical protein
MCPQNLYLCLCIHVSMCTSVHLYLSSCLCIHLNKFVFLVCLHPPESTWIHVCGPPHPPNPPTHSPTHPLTLPPTHPRPPANPQGQVEALHVLAQQFMAEGGKGAALLEKGKKAADTAAAANAGQEGGRQGEGAGVGAVFPTGSPHKEVDRHQDAAKRALYCPCGYADVCMCAGHCMAPSPSPTTRPRPPPPSLHTHQRHVPPSVTLAPSLAAGHKPYVEYYVKTMQRVLDKGASYVEQVGGCAGGRGGGGEGGAW